MDHFSVSPQFVSCVWLILMFYFKSLSAFQCCSPLTWCLATATSNSPVFCKFKALHILKFPMLVSWAYICCKLWRNFSSIQF